MKNFIAMLRYLGYEANYVEGKIILYKNQLLSLTGAKDVETAASVLSGLGVTVAILTSAGEPVAVKIKHTWVEAGIPYSDYRGAGNAAGEHITLPLDTSIKEYHEADNIYDALEEVDITNLIIATNSDANTEANNRQLYLDKIEDEIKNGNYRGLYNRKRVISRVYNTYLPCSLQYEVASYDKTYDVISKDDCDSITFDFDGYDSYTLYAYEAVGKRITVEYVPASSYDREIIDAYGNIFDVPAYLVELRPVLLIDGEEVMSGMSAMAGTEQNITADIYSNGRRAVINNPITAGSIYQITIDNQVILKSDYEKAVEAFSALSETVTKENVYSDAYIGKLLDLA